MNNRDVLLMAIKNAIRGRIKTFLCALSVCVGIFSICTISGLGNGAQKIISLEIDQTGIGGIALYAANNADAIEISNKQINSLMAELPQIKNAMPMTMNMGATTFKNNSVYTAICGVNHAIGDVFNIKLLYGRLPSAFDIKASSFVAVIDDITAQKLFSRENVIGKQVEISFGTSKDKFEIIGVISSQTQLFSSFMGENTPQIIYIPYSTVNQIRGTNAVDNLVISCFAGADEEMTATLAARRLRALNGGVEFKYENMGMYAKSLTNIVGIIAIFISAVAGISIFVGGIGVMNSMISAVEHRTKEIGIYLALGATKRDILKYFLFEAVIICLFGGIIGGGVSYGIMYIVQSILKITINGTLETVLLSICGAAVCGVVFGVVPAIKAASLNPIDAIGKS